MDTDVRDVQRVPFIFFTLLDTFAIAYHWDIQTPVICPGFYGNDFDMVLAWTFTDLA
jgi:hypothetical protein